MSCIRNRLFLRGTYGEHDFRMTDPVVTICPAGYQAYQVIKCCRKCGESEVLWLDTPVEDSIDKEGRL